MANTRKTLPVPIQRPLTRSSESRSPATAKSPVAALFRLFPARMASTTAAKPAVGGEEESEPSKPAAESSDASPSERKAIASYWGINPNKIVKEDGTEWKWSCFMVS